jgi:beta-phosphoglucomutase-like phosphatase (HAD superfamily)
MTLAAVLWDMDGTLVDTEPYWIAREFELVDQFGNGAWTDEHAHALIGFDLRDSARYMIEHGAIDLIADRRELRPQLARILSILMHNPAPAASESLAVKA